jgi:hypothetical protein
MSKVILNNFEFSQYFFSELYAPLNVVLLLELHHKAGDDVCLCYSC